MSFGGFVEEGLRSKPRVPAGCFRALRVNLEGYAPNLRRLCQRPLAGGQEQVAAEFLTLCRSIDGKPTGAKDQYVVATKPSRQIGGDAGELDGPGTDRAVPEITGWLG